MKVPRLLIDVKHWRDRAEEARTIAALFEEPAARRSMLEIANQYEYLARRAERHRAAERQGHAAGSLDAER